MAGNCPSHQRALREGPQRGLNARIGVFQDVDARSCSNEYELVDFLVLTLGADRTTIGCQNDRRYADARVDVLRITPTFGALCVQCSRNR